MFLLLNFSKCIAQSEIHKKVVNTFIQNFNNTDYQKIYDSFSPKMQKAESEDNYFNFFSKIKNNNGSILFLQLTNYRENNQNKSQAKYEAIFQNGNLIIKITTNKNQEIIGLYILKDKILL